MPQKIMTYVLLLLSAMGYVIIGYVIPRENFIVLISCYSGLFLAFFLLYKYLRQQSWWALLGGAIVFRLLFLFSTPSLSDDFYRYVWDGQRTVEGINPFSSDPETLKQKKEKDGRQLSDLDQHLYEHMNSPGYGTVYPTVPQATFAVAAFFGANNLTINVIIIRVFVFIAEILSLFFLIRLLNQMQYAKERVLLYALNPLVIIELSGNIHLEAFGVCFFLMGLYFLLKNKLLPSATGLALSVSSKLLPLMYFPLLWKFLELKKGSKYLLYSGVVSVALLGLVMYPITNLWSTNGFQLYFNHFAFNAGIYYLAMEAGNALQGFYPTEALSMVLPIVCTIIILLISYFNQRKNNVHDLCTNLLLIMTVYYFLATTVNPWYLTWMIVLAPLTAYRYPILWSALIPFTYITFINPPDYRENGWIILAEYVLVYGFFAYELWKNKAKHIPS